MKSIEERADEYIHEMDCSEWTDIEDYARHGYIQGATDEHEKLTQWNSPDNPPKSFVPILLKIKHKGERHDYVSHEIGIYRCRTHIYPGKIHYYQYHDMTASDEVIGWREIQE